MVYGQPTEDYFRRPDRQEIHQAASAFQNLALLAKNLERIFNNKKPAKHPPPLILKDEDLAKACSLTAREIASFNPRIQELIKATIDSDQKAVLEKFQDLTEGLLTFPKFINVFLNGSSTTGLTSAHTGYHLTLEAIDNISKTANQLTQDIYSLYKARRKAEIAAQRQEAKAKRQALKNKSKQRVLPKLIEETEKLEEDAETKALGDQKIDLSSHIAENDFQADAAESAEGSLLHPSYFGRITGRSSIYKKLAVFKSGIPLDGSGKMKSAYSLVAESPELASALLEETKIPATLDPGERAERLHLTSYNLPLAQCQQEDCSEPVLPLPEGMQIVTLSFLDANGQAIKAADSTIQQHCFGSAIIKSSIPKNAVNVVYELEDVDRSFSKDTLAQIADQIPSPEAYRPPGEKKFIEILCTQVPDLKTRAQMVFQYLKDKGYYGSYNKELAKMFNNSGNARDEFISGCRTGSCVPLNWHLCRLLNLAGVPSVLQFGFVNDENEQRFIAEYGHAKALALCEEGPIGFDLALAISKDRVVDDQVLTQNLYNDYQQLLRKANRRDVYKAGKELNYKILRWPKATNRDSGPESRYQSSGSSFQDRTTGGRDYSSSLSFFSAPPVSGNLGIRNQLNESDEIPLEVQALQQAILVDNYYSEYLALIKHSLESDSLQALFVEFETIKPPTYQFHNQNLVPERYRRYLSLHRNGLLREVLESALQSDEPSNSLKKEAASWIAEKFLEPNKINHPGVDKYPWKQLDKINDELRDFQAKGVPGKISSYFYAKSLIEKTDNLESLLKIWDPITSKKVAFFTAYTITSVYRQQGFDRREAYEGDFVQNIKQTNIFIKIIDHLNSENKNLIGPSERSQLTAIFNYNIQTFINRDDASWDFRGDNKFEETKMKNALLQFKAIAKINNENLNHYLSSHVQCLVYSEQFPFRGLSQHLIWETPEADSFYGFFHDQNNRKIAIQIFNQLLAREVHNALMQGHLLTESWKEYPLLPYEINFKGQTAAVMEAAYETLRLVIRDANVAINLPNANNPGSYLHLKFGQAPESICYQNIELIAELCGEKLDYQLLKRALPDSSKFSAAELHEAEMRMLGSYERKLEPRTFYIPQSLTLSVYDSRTNLLEVQYSRPFIKQILEHSPDGGFLFKLIDDHKHFDPFLSELLEQANRLTDFTEVLEDKLRSYDGSDNQERYNFYTALTYELGKGISRQYSKLDAYKLSLGLREALCHAPEFQDFRDHAQWILKIFEQVNQDFRKALENLSLDQLDSKFWQNFYDKSLPDVIKNARLFDDLKQETIAEFMASISCILTIAAETSSDFYVIEQLQTVLTGFHDCSVSFELSQDLSSKDTFFNENDKTAALWHKFFLERRWSTSWDIHKIVREVKKLTEPQRQESRIRIFNYSRYLKENSFYTWRYQGSDEFHQHREYQKGDPLNKVNWHHAARQDNHSPLMVKEHKEKENLKRVLIFDLEYLSEGYKEWELAKRISSKQDTAIYDHFKALFNNLFLCYHESGVFPHLLIVNREYIGASYTPEELLRELSTKRDYKLDHGSPLADFVYEMLMLSFTTQRTIEKEVAILGQNNYSRAAILSQEVNIISGKQEAHGIPPNSEIIAAIHSKNLNQTIPELQAIAARAKGSLTVLK